MTAYETLEQRFARLSALREAAGILHWDMSAMMPPGGAGARSEQLTALDLTCHELMSDPALADLLDEAEGDADSLDTWRQANLRGMRRTWRHETALEPRLVEALAKAQHACEMTWREARPASDFAAVLPGFAALLKLVREAAEAKAAALGCAPYEALLDEYEPGGSAARIDEIFTDLAAFLPGFLGQVLERQAAQPAPRLPPGPFPAAKQEALAHKLMQGVGFDFDHGRLDTSLHPFCGGVPDDVRITTRYDEADFTGALMGVLHETGHAMYERGLPPEWRLQPVGAAAGMALHESQSLLVEMQACRGAEFIGYMAPLARAAFGGQGPAWEADNLLRLATRAAPSFIRVDADEVTYPAHIVLRTRLEKAMIAGDLDPKDVPGAWNEAMESLLGIRPPDDRLGCLQDIHWYDGAFGYFPTYTLGAMAAAQVFATARAAVPDIPAALSRGDFAPLMAWLREKVHSQGALHTTGDLLKQATGKALDPEIFKAHLTARYLG